MSEEIVSVESGATEGTEDFVDLHEATDADLDAFLAREEESPEPAKKLVPEPEKKTKEPEPTKALEPAKEEPAKQDQPPQTPRERKLEAELKQARLYNDRRSSEIGELRKQLREARQRLGEETSDEKWLESPRSAAEAHGKLKDVDSQLQALDREETVLRTRQQSQQLVQQYVEDEEADFETAAQMMLEEGEAPEFVAAFKRDPYQLNGALLVNILKRGHREKVLKAIIPATKKLLEENIQLKKQISEAGNKTAEMIKKNLSQPAGLNGSVPTSSASIEDAAAVNFQDMTDEQLDELLRRAAKSER